MPINVIEIRTIATGRATRIANPRPKLRRTGIQVKPTASAGTVIHGTLYIDDFVDSLQFLSGSQLAALSYEYTIG